MPPLVKINNLLPSDYPARDSIERAVNATLEQLAGGPWTVTLKREELNSDRIAVELLSPRRIALTSLSPNPSDAEIAARLKLFGDSSPS
jgi:hypothetical protein